MRKLFSRPAAYGVAQAHRQLREALGVARQLRRHYGIGDLICQRNKPIHRDQSRERHQPGPLLPLPRVRDGDSPAQHDMGGRRENSEDRSSALFRVALPAFWTPVMRELRAPVARGAPLHELILPFRLMLLAQRALWSARLRAIA